MENVETTEKNQCYIVSLDNGIRNEEPVNIKVYNNFSDGTQLVQLNDTVFGVYKSFSLNPETVYIDDYDIIKSDIAELFDVEHEENRRIVTEDKNIGIFTSLNYSQNIETRISATNIFQFLIDLINNRRISNDEAVWASNTIKILQGKPNPLKDKNQIRDIIELGIFSINKKIELERETPLDNKSKRTIRKKYVRMILFDQIINRKHRGLDYSIITDIDEDNVATWTTVRFGPISISASFDKEQQIPDNSYFINNHYLDKDTLVDVLFEYFYDDIRKFAEAINDAMRLYNDAIVRIIYNNTDFEKGRELEKVVLSNVKTIANKEKAKEKLISNENKINKVERTMATQSINVRVTTKLDLIQKKYPINPKDHPELLNNTKKTTKDEKVKLVVEEDKNSKAGFTNTAILISIVAFVCGVGLGIAYVLLSIGG